MRASRDFLLTLLTAATVLLAIASWSRITVGISHAMAAIVLTGAVVVVAGWGLRLTRTPRWVIPLVQLALAWSVVSIRLTRAPVPLRHVPRLRLEDAFLAAGDTVAHSAPPVPVVQGVLPFVLCGAALAFVVADLLAHTLRLPAVAGLVLLTVLAVPISVVSSEVGITGAARSGVSPWLFALVVAGWLTQVVVTEGDRLERWGRHLDDEPPGPQVSTRSLTGTVAVGGTATVLALVVPLAVPTMHVRLDGFGGGAGSGHVTVTNPMVDVRRNLVQGQDVPLVQVRTDDPDPGYLRIAVLTRFTATQWSAGDRSIPKTQDSHGAVPIAGLSPQTPVTTHRYSISVNPDFDSRWLPTPAPIDAIEAAGDWRYDTNTDDFVAVGKGLTTAGLDYTAVKSEPDLTAAELDDASSALGQVSATYTDQPADLPSIVSQLAQKVTRDADATTPLEQAVALQSWFRDSGEFTYSTATDLGSGATDLARFLGTGPDSKTGYCQQFAAAMAAMARTLGIPSRVAVGFLSPTRESDGSYVYSSHDMHAWPELYFAGAGWVRFEPTPASGTVVPSYAHAPSAVTPEPSTAPSASASAQPRTAQTAKPRANAQQNAGEKSSPIPLTDHHTWRWVALGALIAVLAALVALPGAVRRRRRRTRLRSGSAEEAWSEMRDTAIDLGIPWADGVSPRATRQLLDRYLGTHDGYVALDRLVEAVERERYAATSDPFDRQVLTDVLHGLEQGEPARAVRRAAWWPRSVLRGRRDTGSADRTMDRVG
ncbi:DUF3488 and transglutaminase-like domain-containing protein [Nocardioides sp. BP30]|uniref:transglutaminase family protein n=1 Tax=Nocardioides sp. BP30 TaxID=3036374 RepID=UPI0024696C6B|nr:DUF3488 and transglutaminase-like domain-containing protein [Nocardioides sp. BP30]WGL53850.1 DUF3488 and transglutaminase-like domain-containing protein [Nocardioides sp. BP30]